MARNETKQSKGIQNQATNIKMKVAGKILRQSAVNTDTEPLPMTHEFVAEIDKGKQKFLHSQFPDMHAMYGDVADLGSVRAKNLLTDSPTMIKSTDNFNAAFSCKSLSPANNSRAKYAHCIQNDISCTTNDTWKSVYQHIRNMRPGVITLENVKEIGNQQNTTNNKIIKASSYAHPLKD
jgi:site-specific DNA-cytosine methylase